jgi:branched-chain amino acid transport system ATP-binding protein
MLLEIEGLNSHYGRIHALKSASLTVREGELVALVGANGAGKTTLLRTLSGVHPASSGRITFDGCDITRMKASRRVAEGVVQVPEGRQLFGPQSVEDNLRLGAYRRGSGKPDDDIDRLYEMFPVLKVKRDQPAGTLSGGQQQIVALCRALMAKPRLLLLDEPSMGLAPLLVAEIFDAVQRLKHEGTTILLVEQNAHAALAIADRGYVIETGEIVLSDSGADLLSNERVRQAYLGL